MICNFAGSKPSPFFLTAVLCANGREGQAHLHFPPRAFLLGCPCLKVRVPDPNCNPEIESESYTLNTILKNVEWGWRGQTPTSVGEPDPGRGNFLSPRSCGQSNERLISWYLSRSTFCLPAHRHLGTRSPSGNARGGCRGCTPTSVA